MHIMLAIRVSYSALPKYCFELPQNTAIVVIAILEVSKLRLSSDCTVTIRARSQSLRVLRVFLLVKSNTARK